MKLCPFADGYSVRSVRTEFSDFHKQGVTISNLCGASKPDQLDWPLWPEREDLLVEPRLPIFARANHFIRSNSSRVSPNKSRIRRRSMIACVVNSPCLRAFWFSFGAPDPCAPPCMRQRCLSLTAGERHASPLASLSGRCRVLTHSRLRSEYTLDGRRGRCHGLPQCWVRSRLAHGYIASNSILCVLSTSE
jgi:hypothetical protein